MTTARSPLSKLKAQAVGMAVQLCAAARGEKVDPRFAEALTKDSIKLAIVMDDKVLTIDMTWAAIREAGEVALSEMILKHMREERDNA